MLDKNVIETFADSISSFFREIPECTADEDVEWQLFKAAVASSAARVCVQERPGVANNGKITKPTLEPGGER